MSEASVPAQAEIISGKSVALAGNEHHNVDAGNPGEHWYRLRQDDNTTVPVLEWKGPVAFARAQGALPGIDHEFGTRWGSNNHQRVCLRLTNGDETGLLYVYDPTWDEYAVISTDVPLAAVQDVFARALQVGDQLAVEDFVSLLPHLPTVRPEL